MGPISSCRCGTRSVTTILLIGGSTHVGIAATAFDARDRDLNVVLVRDALTGFALQREFLLEHVFPRMARIRTVDEILAALRSAIAAPVRWMD